LVPRLGTSANGSLAAGLASESASTLPGTHLKLRSNERKGSRRRPKYPSNLNGRNAGAKKKDQGRLRVPSVIVQTYLNIQKRWKTE